LIIRHVKTIKKKNFQKKADEHVSSNMEGSAMFEIKISVIPFMAES
jgi:hypothetical protein